MAESFNNIFDSIDATISDGLAGGFRDFHWNLPRNVGTTTWFLNRITKDLDAGLKVLYLNNRAFRHIENSERVLKHKNVELFTTRHTEFNTAGMKFDRIYLDTHLVGLTISEQTKKMYLHTLRQSLTSDGYLVEINSINGF